MNGGENAQFGDGAVEVDLHVAGALEFLKNEIVHAAVGLDEGRGEDGEAAALLHVARGAEEFTRLGRGSWNRRRRSWFAPLPCWSAASRATCG